MTALNTCCWQCSQSYKMRCLVCPNCEAVNANQDLTQANAESIDQETVYEKSARWTWPDGRPEL